MTVKRVRLAGIYLSECQSPKEKGPGNAPGPLIFDGKKSQPAVLVLTVALAPFFRITLT
jgi:hypothetical protein